LLAAVLRRAELGRLRRELAVLVAQHLLLAEERIVLRGDVAVDRTVLVGVLPDRAVLCGAALGGLVRVGTGLVGAVLEATFLDGAALVGAVLDGLVLERAILDRAVLEGSVLGRLADVALLRDPPLPGGVAVGLVLGAAVTG